MGGFSGTASLLQRLDNNNSSFDAIAKAVMAKLRVAMPGIIESFDPIKQTATVDIAVYDRIKPGLPNSIPTYSPITGDLKIPTLIDVPVLIPRGGGFATTIPVQPGDECLVVFADMCINEWFDAGGYTNVQQVLRRHNLSDGFAILAPTSQPKVLTDYATDAMELRTEDNLVNVSVQADNVTITAPTINLDGLLNLAGTPLPSVGSPTFYLPIEINGVSYKLMLQPA